MTDINFHVRNLLLANKKLLDDKHHDAIDENSNLIRKNKGWR